MTTETQVKNENSGIRSPPASTHDSHGGHSLPELNLIKTLFHQRGHRVLEAHNGAEALLALAFEPPDVVVSDGVMPILDGYQFCRILKNDSSTRLIPVILLTGQAVGRRKLEFSGHKWCVAAPLDLNALVLEVAGSVWNRGAQWRNAVSVRGGSETAWRRGGTDPGCLQRSLPRFHQGHPSASTKGGDHLRPLPSDEADERGSALPRASSKLDASTPSAPASNAQACTGPNLEPTTSSPSVAPAFQDTSNPSGKDVNSKRLPEFDTSLTN